jgi:glucose/arabinose dehydrogenase
MRRLALLPLLALAGCTAAPAPSAPAPSETTTPSSAAPSPSADPTPTESSSPIPETHELDIAEHETFDDPWAMAFLPGTDELVITGRQGDLWLRGPGGVREVDGAPDVVVAGQGGLGDIIPGPTFEADGRVYLSWVEGDGGGSGAVVGTGLLDVADARLTDLDVIWEQTPKVSGNGHFSHRLAIQGDYLFVSSGDRQHRSSTAPSARSSASPWTANPPPTTPSRARTPRSRSSSGRWATAMCSASPSTPTVGSGPRRWARRAATS